VAARVREPHIEFPGTVALQAKDAFVIDVRELNDFAQRYTQAWCSGDPARVASFYAPLGTLTINDGPPATGREMISAAAASFMLDFPDMVVAMNGLRVENDRAIYHWTLTGSNTGPGGTGKQVHFSGFEVWQFAPSGLIQQSHGNFDRNEFERQLHDGAPNEAGR
jgi:uncharacterized protein (TIGR02246 family)